MVHITAITSKDSYNVRKRYLLTFKTVTIMAKYLVRFKTTDGDYDKEWCHADSASEAENEIRSEHWNYAETISVEEL